MLICTLNYYVAEHRILIYQAQLLAERTSCCIQYQEVSHLLKLYPFSTLTLNHLRNTRQKKQLQIMNVFCLLLPLCLTCLCPLLSLPLNELRAKISFVCLAQSSEAKCPAQEGSVEAREASQSLISESAGQNL